jgi:hypothetical protein
VVHGVCFLFWVKLRWWGLGFGVWVLREPPGGPRSGGEAMSEAKPVRWRPEAKRRGTPKITKNLMLDKADLNLQRNSKNKTKLSEKIVKKTLTLRRVRQLL